MSRRTIRLIVLSYAVKSVLLLVLWTVAPDVPAQALGRVREAFACMLAWAKPTRG